MNSVAQPSDPKQLTAFAGALLSDGRVVFNDSYWKSAGSGATDASGLPLHWLGGKPVTPAMSRSRSFQLFLKRLFDLVVASMALIFLAPLLLAVALAVKLSSRGPVLFRQAREGLDGTLFSAFKFRSMKQDECDPTGVAQTVKDDPRVTAIGKFIRRTSIDELPQLLNVIRGDMSLVGPRPHVAGMMAAGVNYRVLVPYYDARLSMAPGITGWAQANGYRGMTTDAASAIGRVDHDVAYIQNFSIWLDIKIIIKTIVGEFVTGTGH